MTTTNEPKFKLGKIVQTPGASHIAMGEKFTALDKHQSGDWGLTCEEDKQVNEEALEHEGRVMSVWKSSEGVGFWIITEWDRSVTTILLPSEY